MTALVRDDLSTLFTIPADQWSAINKRVGLAIVLQQFFLGSGLLPSFPALLAASTVWKASTFPSLVTQSGALATYATAAIADFTTLQQSIAALGAATTVPDALQTAVRATLARLHAATSTQADGFTALVQPIDAFRIASDGMDKDLAQAGIALNFPSATSQTLTVATAVADVEGRWTALRDDLAASTGDIDVTMPFLTSLDIATAIAAWQRIQTEATAFASMAAGQQVYLNGDPPVADVEGRGPGRSRTEGRATMIIENDLQQFLAAATTGPVAQATIVPVQAAVTTNLRVTYEWLYSSLNCDAGDSSTFLWTIVKLDDTHIALSPSQAYNGMTLYASVRPDIGYGVQVQAPYSADWITAIGGDETITVNFHDLLLVSFQGLNGSYLAVNSSPDEHDGHTGYRVFSTGGTEALFLMRPTASLQSGLEFRQTIEWTPERIGQVLGDRGTSLPAETLHRLSESLS